jgi:hypothetical protein
MVGANPQDQHQIKESKSAKITNRTQPSYQPKATSSIMGGSSSKPNQKDEKITSFAQRIKAAAEDEIAKRAMMQREVQMSLNIARARDTLQIFGSLWLTLTVGAGAARLVGRPVPGIVGVPIVVGAIVLGNIADLAYGNKMLRVAREAEYILSNEQDRFVPFPQVRVVLMISVVRSFEATSHRASYFRPLFPSFIPRNKRRICTTKLHLLENCGLVVCSLDLGKSKLGVGE